jgi:hypothetical protein
MGDGEEREAGKGSPTSAEGEESGVGEVSLSTAKETEGGVDEERLIGEARAGDLDL